MPKWGPVDESKLLYLNNFECKPSMDFLYKIQILPQQIILCTFVSKIIWEKCVHVFTEFISK